MAENKSQEAIILKIKKLFALARKNPNQHESEAAAAKAQELLMEYNLSEEQLDAFRSREERITQQFYQGHRSVNGLSEVKWKLQLSHAVARNNLCSVIHHPWKKEISWIGTEPNIEISKFLYETLVWDIEHIADKLWKDILEIRALETKYDKLLFKDSTLRYVHGKTWKKSFYLGMVKSLSDRLTANLGNLRTNTNINALVLVNDAAINKYIADTFGTLGHARWESGGSINGSGYRAGVEKGKTLEFRRGVGYGGVMGPKQISG